MFIRYVKLYKLINTRATVKLNKLKNYFELFGKPEVILRDNRNQFTSQKWKQTLQELGIKPKFTAQNVP